MNNLEFIGTCANGKYVFNRLNSHLHKDVSKEILKNALSQLSPSTSFHKEIVDMKQIIGKSHCVSVNESDDIVYVIRKGRKGPTPMVKNREAINCSSLTIILKKMKDENYILISAYIGDESEPEPWNSQFYYQNTWEKNENIDEIAYQKSIDFWNTHALIYDEEDISLFLS